MTASPASLAPTPLPAPLDEARRVLRIEAEAILALAGAIPVDFEPAVTLILEGRGRVVVSGMGKSGHVGRKIASTLASTGTPAVFVHPAEASHGDLGMIGEADICLLISNSGETAELRDILAHAGRFSIPVIAISSRPESTLMQAAAFRLLLPPAPEACAIGMAPTTSTTLTLALGDALAVAVMAQRGFRPESFHLLHPGGKLGARLLRVAALMHAGAEIPLVGTAAPMAETLLTMTARGFGITGVTEGGRLVGVISDGDLRRNMDRLMSLTAGEIATRAPVTVPPGLLAAEALALMTAKKIGALMVVEEGDRPVGILHLHDLLRAGVV